MEKLPYAIIKGEVLSIKAYGGEGYRKCGDLDLLVPRTYTDKIKEILKNNGFLENIFDKNGKPRLLTRQEKIMFMNSHQIVPFVKNHNCSNEIPVDINVDIFWGEYERKRIDMETFLEDTESMIIYDIPVKVLSDIKCFFEVCLHHYKEMQAPYYLAMANPFNEKMFQDIYSFYKKSICNQMNALIDYVFENQVEEVFFYIFYYTSWVFNDDEMKIDCKKFETAEGLKKINSYGLTNDERKEWPISFIDRMNHPDIFSVIKPFLSERDIQKINTVLSIFI